MPHLWLQYMKKRSFLDATARSSFDEELRLRIVVESRMPVYQRDHHKLKWVDNKLICLH